MQQDLEPHICAKIMRLHHDEHHKAYVENLNKAEKQLAGETDLRKRIALEADIRFNGGGESVSSSVKKDNHANATPPQGIATIPSSGKTSLQTVLKTPNRRKALISQRPCAALLEALMDSRNSSTTPLHAYRAAVGVGWYICLSLVAHF